MTKTQLLYNVAQIVIPWSTLLFMRKQDIKRYSFSGFVIVAFEIINHIIGYKRNWWTFYGKKKSFFTNELPFSLGAYMPLSMWLLKFFFGDFKKFLLANAVSDGMFAFVIIKILKRIKVIKLNMSYPTFFVYLYFKAPILYAVQYLVEKRKLYIG
jgi:hypothetical protein